MSAKLKTIAIGAPLADLVPILADGYVVIIVDGERFYGLITRIDFLNYLRRRLK
jgi:cystathionine beta-synthase